MALHRIATVTDIPAGTAQCFEVTGRRIAVFNMGNCFLAIDDECPHQGGPLSEGTVAEGCVSCPWHGAEFELQTGKVLTPPAVEDVRSYKTVISGNDLLLEVE